MNHESILKKVERIRTKFADPATPEDSSIVEALGQAVQEAILREHLAEHDAMKPLLRRMFEKVRVTNRTLQTADSKTLPDSQRDRLIDERDFYQEFLEYFTGTKDNLRSLEAELDKQLANE